MGNGVQNRVFGVASQRLPVATAIRFCEVVLKIVIAFALVHNPSAVQIASDTCLRTFASARLGRSLLSGGEGCWKSSRRRQRKWSKEVWRRTGKEAGEEGIGERSAASSTSSWEVLVNVFLTYCAFFVSRRTKSREVDEKKTAARASTSEHELSRPGRRHLEHLCICIYCWHAGRSHSRPPSAEPEKSEDLGTPRAPTRYCFTQLSLCSL